MDHTSHLTRRRILSGAALASAAPLAHAHVDGRSQPQLLRRPYKPADGGEERNYFLYVPTGFYTETGSQWPVMLFLHGGGERGNGRDELDHTLAHGPVMEAWIQGRDLPFLIIQPQLPAAANRTTPLDPARIPQRRTDGPPPARNYGNRSDKPMARVETGQLPDWAARAARDQGRDLIEKDLLMMIYETIADFRGDENRVYCTGLSFGGAGTWHFAQTHPERFAAVAPICGPGDPSKMQPIADAKLPIWIHQGGRDTTVSAESVLASAKALEAAGHPEVRFTVHEDLGHNVWTRVYEGDDLYNWLLRNRRKT
jgi:predicted peptidase